jgi:thiamine-monophosphate kinase
MADYASDMVQRRRSGANLHPLSDGGGELALLETIRRRAAGITASGRGTRIRLGIGDDCALLRPAPGEEIAVTTDLSIESRHFRLDWHPPESVGHRTLARGLSDLAAMGARPVAAFLSLGIPTQLSTTGSDDKRWVDRFLDGLMALASEHHVPLAGGDLAQSPVALADIVLLGAVPRGRALLRSGAKPGDRIFVTGRLGGAAAELAVLSAEPGAFTDWTLAREGAPHLYPQPRVMQGIWLRKNRIATAAMDLSDGLSTDLRHICDESRVAAEVDASKIPLGKEATLQMALDGGEDYELLFTAKASTKVPRRIAGVAVTEIGRIVRAHQGRPVVTLLTGDHAAALEAKGWEHFAGR